VRDSEALHPDEDEWKIAILTALFNRIKAMGTRVIIRARLERAVARRGVCGHNIPQQIAWINRALEPVVADGTVTGVGLWEMTLSQCEESSSDHAAKWETSNMMFFYPDLVRRNVYACGYVRVGHGASGPQHAAPRWDWRIGSPGACLGAADVGRRNVELAAAAIGQKARPLFESLPENLRGRASTDRWRVRGSVFLRSARQTGEADDMIPKLQVRRNVYA
jgi:hypothetical protein